MSNAYHISFKFYFLFFVFPIPSDKGIRTVAGIKDLRFTVQAHVQDLGGGGWTSAFIKPS